jgi:uncharacterized protein YjbJ (UPF0337 family)
MISTSSTASAINWIHERYGYQKDQAIKEIDDWYGRQTW